MRTRVSAVIAAAALICLIPAAGNAAVTAYSQDFELLDQADPTALETDDWLVFGNVFDSGGAYLYPYGPFPAPNHNLAFCHIVQGEGGVDQGWQQLSVFSDYENTDHGLGYLIESNVYREWTIGAENIGQRWTFIFEAKMGNLEGASTAAAFIKTLDPSSGFALTNFITADMTNIPITWAGYSLSIEIDASLENQILQIGFMNTATLYEGSGIIYDNILFDVDLTAVPGYSAAAGAELRQNYPNPFNPKTRIEFVMDEPGMAELSVYDLAGRRVATLHQGDLIAGEHHMTWDGRTDSGTPVAAGQYQYVLQTASGRISGSMVLVK